MDYNERKYLTDKKESGNTSFYKKSLNKKDQREEFQRIKDKLITKVNLESKETSQERTYTDSNIILPDIKNSNDKSFFRKSKISLTPLKKLINEKSFLKKDSSTPNRSDMPSNNSYNKSGTQNKTIKEEDDSIRNINPSDYVNDYIETEVYHETENSVHYPELKYGIIHKLNKNFQNRNTNTNSSEKLFLSNSYKNLNLSHSNKNLSIEKNSLYNNSSKTKFSFEKTFIKKTTDFNQKMKERLKLRSTDSIDSKKRFYENSPKNSSTNHSEKKSPFVNNKMYIKLKNKKEDLNKTESDQNSKLKKLENLNVNLNVNLNKSYDPVYDDLSQNRNTKYYENKSSHIKSPIILRKPLNESLLECSFSLSGITNSPCNKEKIKEKYTIFRENEISILKNINSNKIIQRKSDSNNIFKQKFNFNVKNKNISNNSINNLIKINNSPINKSLRTKTLTFNMHTIKDANNLLDTHELTTITQVQNNQTQNENCNFIMDCIEDIHFEFVKYCIKSKKLMRIQESGLTNPNNLDDYKTVISMDEISLD